MLLITLRRDGATSPVSKVIVCPLVVMAFIGPYGVGQLSCQHLSGVEPGRTSLYFQNIGKYFAVNSAVL
ncbi:MAG TPA: hypothetical protein VIQ29_07205, partial [Ancylobacter sp.]